MGGWVGGWVGGCFGAFEGDDQACVDRLRKAERVLAVEKEQHSEESAEEDAAAAKLPPQDHPYIIA